MNLFLVMVAMFILAVLGALLALTNDPLARNPMKVIMFLIGYVLGVVGFCGLIFVPIISWVSNKQHEEAIAMQKMGYTFINNGYYKFNPSKSHQVIDYQGHVILQDNN